MIVWTWVNDHRWWATIPVVLVLLAAATVAFWFFVLRSSGNPVDLRDAIRLYRQDQGGTPGATAAGLPQPGVYQYTTTGGEQLNVADISRSFPSLTNMIVTDGRCAAMQWDALAEHTEQVVECAQPGGALSLAQRSIPNRSPMRQRPRR